MPLIFDHVYYTYDASSPLPSKAIEDIHFTLNEPFFCGIIGQTGSGKSTLVQQINALLRPTQGKVIVGEFVVDSSKKKMKEIKSLRKYAGLVFQFAEYQLFEETVLKDVSFGPKNFKENEEVAVEKAKKALKKVGIPEEYFSKSPFELSGGEKRRVAIAGLLAMEPQILILDEPTAGLDPKGAQEILALFYDLYQNGTSILLITHDMNVVLKYCTSVMVLHQGKLLGMYSPLDVFYQKELLSEAEIDAPDLICLVEQMEKKGFSLNRQNIRDIESLVAEIKKMKGEGK